MRPCNKKRTKYKRDTREARQRKRAIVWKFNINISEYTKILSEKMLRLVQAAWKGTIRSLNRTRTYVINILHFAWTVDISK